MKIAGQIGINLKVDSNYGSDEKLSYYNSTPDTICGDNDDPTWVSQVRTKAP